MILLLNVPPLSCSAFFLWCLASGYTHAYAALRIGCSEASPRRRSRLWNSSPELPPGLLGYCLRRRQSRAQARAPSQGSLISDRSLRMSKGLDPIPQLRTTLKDTPSFSTTFRGSWASVMTRRSPTALSVHPCFSFPLRYHAKGAS